MKPEQVKKVTFNGLIQSSNLAVLGVDREEKLYTREGLLSLVKIFAEREDVLAALDRAVSALESVGWV